MNIPQFDVQVFTNKDGTLTPQGSNFLDQLIDQLTKGVGIEGFQISPLTIDQINKLAIINQTQNGTMVYDSNNNAMKVFINGSWKTFTVT